MRLYELNSKLRGECEVLRSHGNLEQARTIERVLDQVMEADEVRQLQELTEQEAMMYTGRQADYLRARFPDWEKRGLARQVGRRRLYCTCVLIHRGNAEAAREEGRRAVRAS